MEITQADIDGLAAKLAALDLTAGEAATLELALAGAAADGAEVEGFYYRYELTNLRDDEAPTSPRLRSDAVKSRLDPLRGFNIGMPPT